MKMNEYLAEIFGHLRTHRFLGGKLNLFHSLWINEILSVINLRSECNRDYCRIVLGNYT